MSKNGSKRLTNAVAQSDSGVNLSFKLLSAIGIIIIVSGHCYKGGISLAYDWFPIYSFNLALFVFISGYFYKDKHEDNVLNTYGAEQKDCLSLHIFGILHTVYS